MRATYQPPCLSVRRKRMPLAQHGVTCEKAARMRRRRGDLGGVEVSATLAGCAIPPGILSDSSGAIRFWSTAAAMRGIATPCDALRRRARNDSGGSPMRVP